MVYSSHNLKCGIAYVIYAMILVPQYFEQPLDFQIATHSRNLEFCEEVTMSVIGHLDSTTRPRYILFGNYTLIAGLLSQYSRIKFVVL